ncbi:MAG TPA: GAF domain-containing protein [Candidatus Limnocylindrales bacterium]|nr:GAF domain-containing protein [Candidatus Limnocylindrales bacterium]
MTGEDRGDGQAQDAGVVLLRSVALRAETALRLEAELQTKLLRSIVGTTVQLFEAEAASIALYRPETETLEFVIAAGAQGQGVVGLSIPADQGIAGHAFTTGEPISIAESRHDARFTSNISAGTGYTPRSILAVPMRSETGSAGVLEVLDKHEGTFSLRDIELASVFADQAAVAIQIGARALDAQQLLRLMLAGDVPEDGDALQEMIAAATRNQSGDDRFWAFVDSIVQLRLVEPHDRSLAIDVLDAVGRHARQRKEHSAPRRFRR